MSRGGKGKVHPLIISLQWGRAKNGGAVRPPPREADEPISIQSQNQGTRDRTLLVYLSIEYSALKDLAIIEARYADHILSTWQVWWLNKIGFYSFIQGGGKAKEAFCSDTEEDAAKEERLRGLLAQGFTLHQSWTKGTIAMPQ